MAEQQQSAASNLQTAIENFKNLPKNMQFAVYGLLGFFVLVFIVRMGGDDAAQQAQQVAQQPAQQQQEQPPVDVGGTSASRNNQPSSADDGTSGFMPVESSRESLRRGFISQQQMAMAKLREELQSRSAQQEEEFERRNRELKILQEQLQQTMESLNQQMQLLEESNARQRDEIAQLADQARRQAEASARSGGSPAAQQTQAPRRQRQERISQTPLSAGLGAPGSGGVGGDQALLQGVLKTTTGRTAGLGEEPTQQEPERNPFIPPLGFIRGTLLNGFDALASGGMATPALVRLEGRYKTAMNSTVILDGCFMLVEFEGDISTERAKGKPSRMTCVYPDQGAVTYDVTGYVVDAQDGVEGIPGVFFEGDSGRIALSIAAQFASGVANVASSAQQTTSVGADGTFTQAFTGSEGKAALGSGVSSALDRLTDYLIERAERVSPFIRIDALRKIHVVLLSGTELRAEGDAWSLMFDGSGM